VERYARGRGGQRPMARTASLLSQRPTSSDPETQAAAPKPPT
jgi:hypothetical protein